MLNSQPQRPMASSWAQGYVESIQRLPPPLLLTHTVQFTVAQESEYPDHRKQLILETVDGGASTLK